MHFKMPCVLEGDAYSDLIANGVVLISERLLFGARHLLGEIQYIDLKLFMNRRVNCLEELIV